MLVFVFASFLAILPLVIAIASIMTTFLLLLGLTEVTSVSPIVQFLIALLGLGVAIDYSLIVVSRWREERAHGRTGDEAVQKAMETAGRAVVFSGITVAIGLLALVALPLPFLRSMGYAGMLIPLVSTLSAITLLPVVLSKVGPRLDWPHRHTDDKASRAWTRWATAVSRHRWVAAISGMAVVLALVVAATDLQFGASDADTVAKSGDARDGLVALERAGIGEGALLPHEILIEGGTDPGAAGGQARRRRGHPRRRRPGGRRVAARRQRARRGDPDPRQRQRGGRGHACRGPRHGPCGRPRGSRRRPARGQRRLHRRGLRELPADDRADHGDDLHPARAGVPLAAAALKAIVLNILSVAAAWGVLVLVWQHGYGSEAIWGVEATGSIPSWMPLMIFAFLFGLSMDYEVFILTRMREEYDRTGSTETAVIQGIGRTGRLVTSAALILFLTFVTMAASPGTDLKMFATGLGAGILLDATIIRALIVPAVISLMGRYNWWLPAWPARLLRVEPSVLRPRQSEA